MKISIIIPAKNEQATISHTINNIENTLNNLEHEIIVINDYSIDNTERIVMNLISNYPLLRLIENSGSPGIADALRSGFKEAHGDLILPVMADLCDDPCTIKEMYRKIQEGFDIVCGSRYMKGGSKVGGPKLKSFFSRFFGLSLYFLVGIPTHDITNSFKLYRKEVIKNIEINSRGFEISAEIPLKAFFYGYKITEVPTTWIDRKGGESKFDIPKEGPTYFKLYLWALFRNLLKILHKIFSLSK